MKKKKIGLLGGIGPEATGKFYLKLIATLQRKNSIKENKDFPQVIINSIPAPELLNDKTSERDLELYIKGLKELEKLGVDFIAMICNTIHLFREKLQKKIKVPIIDLPTEVKKYLKNKGLKTATLLSTALVTKAGLYKFKNIKYLELDKDEIALLGKTVFDLNRGYQKKRQEKIVEAIAKKYLQLGAECLILGCTELALMLENKNIPKIDPMDILSEAILRRL